MAQFPDTNQELIMRPHDSRDCGMYAVRVTSAQQWRLEKPLPCPFLDRYDLIEADDQRSYPAKDIAGETDVPFGNIDPTCQNNVSL